MFTHKEPVVAVIGLGYVGLPLAVELAKKYVTVGFDISEQKISAYRRYQDPSREVSRGDLKAAIASGNLRLTNDPRNLKNADILIVAVPTPVDSARTPDFSPLIEASTTVGKHIQRGAIVIYESTVYPGATEEICIPVIENASGFKWLKDFNVGYSPERVNPGDRERTITKIVKVVAADDQKTLDVVGSLYESIITSGVHRASSIKVAEAAKVIENTQRDLNIALMNELSVIFNKLDIDTAEVLEAAGTKWNFLPFRPGLVGGHCIGVDPYYLTHKAEMLGYHPQVILSGRRINDGMASYVAQQIIKQIINMGATLRKPTVIVLGMTFKENCPDLRNSKIGDLTRELSEYGCVVCAHDPIADPSEALREHGVTLTAWNKLPAADAIVVAVPHKDYLETPLEKLLEKLKPEGVFADLKSSYPKRRIGELGFKVWRM